MGLVCSVCGKNACYALHYYDKNGDCTFSEYRCDLHKDIELSRYRNWRKETRKVRLGRFNETEKQ
jgi:hypothetical protein